MSPRFYFEGFVLDIKPVFFENFSCKADKCTDTCCAGWEVDIDSDTIDKYNMVSGNFSERLLNGIVTTGGQKCFKLDENDRCCFLENSGLCAVYSNLGKEYLCEICTEHPRFYDEYDSVTEMGLGLCCEKTCELLFACSNNELFEYDFLFEECESDIEILLSVRKTCFDIIKNSNINLRKRISELLAFAEKAQYECFGEEPKDFHFDSIVDYVNFVIQNYRKTEPINDKWINNINNLCDFSSSLQIIQGYIPDSSVYEKLLSYIIYRHFMKCRFDGRLAAVTRFAVWA